MQAKLQLQIFGQELFSAILEVFSPLFCKQVMVLVGERAGFSCSLCPALQSGAGSGRAGTGCLRLPALPGESRQDLGPKLGI